MEPLNPPVDHSDHSSWGPPKRQGLCSHWTHQWTIYTIRIFLPAMKSWGQPIRQRSVATPLTIRPLLKVFPALYIWGSPKREAL